MLAIPLGLLRRPIVRWGLAGLIGVEAGAIGIFYLVEAARLKANENQVTYNPREIVRTLRKYDVKGLKTPRVFAADDSGLDPSEEVVGVVSHGKARAYRLRALRDRDRHVVNDLVGGAAVSIVFCDISNCVRVYANPKETEPLDIGTAGLIEGEMVVRIGTNYYLQSSGAPVDLDGTPAPSSAPIGCETPLPERMTWGEWRLRHPETDVFVGVPKRVGE